MPLSLEEWHKHSTLHTQTLNRMLWHFHPAESNTFLSGSSPLHAAHPLSSRWELNNAFSPGCFAPFGALNAVHEPALTTQLCPR